MISMICSRNLTDPNIIKGFYHLITHPPSPTPYFLKPHLASGIPPASRSVVPPPGPPDPPSPSFVCLFVCTCVLPDAEPNSVALVALTVTVWVRFFFFFYTQHLCTKPQRVFKPRKDDVKAEQIDGKVLMSPM